MCKLQLGVVGQRIEQIERLDLRGRQPRRLGEALRADSM